MVHLLKENWSDDYDFIVMFANTGLEHPKTLDFIHQCDIMLGFNTIWVEASVYHDERKGTGYKIVDYFSASRKGEPFEEVIKKYGIANQNYPHCTRELKLSPMTVYRKENDLMEHPCAIGIRYDERRRVSPSQQEKFNIIYPLVDDFPTDKIEVLDFWKNQPFDLEIDEFEGNCLGCFKKSQKKQFMQIERDPSAFDFFRRMEQLHGKDRLIFRGNLDVDGLFKMYDELKGSDVDQIPDYENGGCSESCEMFDMSTLPKWLK